MKWIVDDRSRENDFCYRLTGKESNLVLLGFMFLVNAIRGDSEDPRLLSKLLFLVFLGIKLRDCL